MLKNDLRSLQKRGLFRHPRTRSSRQGPVITIQGRRYINFASNDYLGLAAHPDIIKAAQDAVVRFGVGAGASRLLAGGTVLHERLEKAVAAFKGTEAALVFNSGYAANTGIIPSIANEGDAVFSDALNHASIVDGCRLSRAEKHIYAHRDMKHLEVLLCQAKSARRKIIITDSVFSMDGDIAPLTDLAAVARKYRALLYLDDAHGTGLLGQGKGALEHFGIKPEPWILQMGTFSKALGTFGAFAAGSRIMIDWLVNRSRSFIFSTALPPPVIAASLAALRLLGKDKALISRLLHNKNLLTSGLQGLGLDSMGSETPIIPVRTRTIKKTLALSNYLFLKGIYAPAIRPPTVAEPRIRLTVTAGHTEGHIEKLLKALKTFGEKRKE
ncbi:MAG: 8-amino-7-oxononanoate synthase [Thermodesulfovibrio sp.]|nr:8-amino-7-oxononanoate synthase [Thermodesulfovibrio sp.]